MKERTKTGTSGIVYSTEQGTMCPDCGQAIANCRCKEENGYTTGDGIVRVGRETKGRKGKFVSLVTGISLDAMEMQMLARTLKQKCGTGGTVKNGIIEIQGDHRDRLVGELQKLGFTVKRAGG
jgi:translation initiation factor 1